VSAPSTGIPVTAKPARPAVLPADRTTRLELLAFIGIIVLAATLRLMNLATRGTWDADQGHDMLVLRDLVQNGTIPLLGPPTSIGDFHHGMLYYVLLAPAAFVSNADPTVVSGWIALGGIVAVAVTGWLGRSIAGPVAGLVAAALMAVSASAVDESTFIWNPNLIALTSSVALAAAWRAWQTGRARWWVVAGAASVATMHCHVLGVILTPIVASLLLADVRRRRARGDRAGATGVGRAAVAWVVLFLLSYLPLAVHEASSSGSEIRAAIAFVTSGGGGTSVSLLARLPIVGLRVLGWPLTGLITDAPIPTILAAAFVIGLAAWRGWGTGRRAATESHGASPGASSAEIDERRAVRWLSLGLLWTVIALAVGAASLATVVIGLPNDHYHAFADPIVFVLVGVGAAALARLRAPAPAAGPVAAALAVAVLLGWNAVHQPPAVAADGGWPAAETAAARVLVAGGGGPVVLDSLPAVKSAEALQFPLEQLEPGIVRPMTAIGSDATRSAFVVLCDQRFHETIGANCGGAAEDARMTALLGEGSPARPDAIDRFQAAPDRWITVYRLSPRVLSIRPVRRPLWN
jgi:Dolichyl-phosphate-mannose-protein mannosyltransferase